MAKKTKRRTKTLKVRLSEDEERQAQTRAALTGEATAVLVRRLLRDDPPPTPQADKEFRALLVKQLSGGMNNLNQIAKAANSGNVDLSSITELKEIIRDGLKKALNI